MRALRRGLIVLGVAVLAGGLIRLRGKGGVPPTSGGWRELEAPDFRRAPAGDDRDAGR